MDGLFFVPLLGGSQLSISVHWKNSKLFLFAVPTRFADKIPNFHSSWLTAYGSDATQNFPSKKQTISPIKSHLGSFLPSYTIEAPCPHRYRIINTKGIDPAPSFAGVPGLKRSFNTAGQPCVWLLRNVICPLRKVHISPQRKVLEMKNSNGLTFLLYFLRLWRMEDMDHYRQEESRSTQ
jgi:hypothetical protein